MNPPVPPRVLIVSTERGAGSGAYRMLEYFLEAAPAGAVRLAVAAPAASAVSARARALGFPVLPWPAPADRALANWRAGRALAVPDGADVVHAWHSRGFEAALALAGRLGAAATATLHDHPVDTAHGLLRRVLMRRGARRLDALVSVSRSLAAAWVPFAGKTPVTVIPNGLPDRPPPARAPSARLRVGFAGLHAPEVKGWPRVRGWIDAAGPEYEWHLFGGAGTGPADADARARWGDRAVWHGWVEPEEVFARVDVLVHPSFRFDSYPTLLLEAARAGVPALTTRAGGSLEIVRDGETGLVLEDSDTDAGGVPAALQRLRDPGLRARLGAAARAGFTARHLAGRMAAAYASFWAGAAAARPRPR